GNLATTNGGGLSIVASPGAPPPQLRSTIVAGNSAPSLASFAGPDITGPVTSLGNNFVGVGDGSTGLTDGVNGDQVGTAAAPRDPKLGPLGDNGGFNVLG